MPNIRIYNYILAAIEEQAIDRVHRVGQKKPVHVVRFIIKVSQITLFPMDVCQLRVLINECRIRLKRESWRCKKRKERSRMER